MACAAGHGVIAAIVWLVTLMVVGLAGCRSAAPVAGSADPTPPAAPLAAHVFDCADGPSFVLARVRGDAAAGEAVDLVLPDRRYRLPRVVAASGVHYEPGWVLELLADRLVFVDAYGARRVTTPRPARQSASTSGDDVYAAATESHRLTVRIRPGPCVDTMSGDRHASSVEVELDARIYRGCGDALAR